MSYIKMDILYNCFCDVKDIRLNYRLDMPELSNKYLVRRKHMLIFSLVLLLFSLSYLIYDISGNDSLLRDQLTESSYTKYLVYLNSDLVLACFSIFCIGFSLSEWKRYNVSSRYILIFYLINFICENVLLYVPGDVIIQYKEASNILPKILNLINLENSIYKFLLLHISISHSIRLLDIFTECNHLRFLLTFLVVIYIPIIMIIGSFIYVFLYSDIKVIFCVLFYSVYLILNILKVRNIRFIKNIFLLLFIALLIGSLYENDIHIISNIITFIIRYNVYGVMIRDIILNTIFYVYGEVIRFTSSEEDSIEIV